MSKTKILIKVSILSIILIIYSCSSSNETADQNGNSLKSDSIYVFDQPVNIIKTDTLETQPKVKTPQIDIKYYIVQIGAFTTRDKAEEFTAESRKILKNKVEISYSNNVNLFVVQLMPPFSTKEEAESVRNNLWKVEKFKDAWILTVIK